MIEYEWNDPLLEDQVGDWLKVVADNARVVGRLLSVSETGYDEVQRAGYGAEVPTGKRIMVRTLMFEGGESMKVEDYV